MEASSLQLSPPTSYQPAIINLPRFQRLVEGEGVKRSNGEVVDVSSIAHSGSQQRDGEATIPSNMSSTESEDSIIHTLYMCCRPHVVYLYFVLHDVH